MQTLTEKKCKRCNWQWFPRSTDEPTICPKCKSPYWNRERKGGRPKGVKNRQLVDNLENNNSEKL